MGRRTLRHRRQSLKGVRRRRGLRLVYAGGGCGCGAGPSWFGAGGGCACGGETWGARGGGWRRTILGDGPNKRVIEELFDTPLIAPGSSNTRQMPMMPMMPAMPPATIPEQPAAPPPEPAPAPEPTPEPPAATSEEQKTEPPAINTVLPASETTIDKPSPEETPSLLPDKKPANATNTGTPPATPPTPEQQEPTLTGGYRATRRNRELLARLRRGESIGFTATASLKAKGLIPRTSRKNKGKKIVSPKYR
jgi:hypothetical protein